jgi:Flp pilus assembly protein TadG
MDAMKRMLRRCRADEGAQLVEFALVLPLLLLVVLGIAEFGFLFQRYEVITNAAREGARMAVLPGYSSPIGQAAVAARVQAYVAAGRVPVSSGTPGNPTVLLANATIPVAGGLPPVNVKRVTVTYTHTYMFISGIAALFGNTYTTVPLTAVAEMRTESGS